MSMVQWVQTWQRFFRDAQAARALGGPLPLRQGVEALLLRLPPSRLGLTEYHDYRLFNPALRWADKRRFVGWRGEPALDRGNAPAAHVYADDKISLATLLHAAGLPQPRLQAVVWRGAEHLPGCRSLSDPTALAQWLRGEARYPLFMKPAHAGFGRGALWLEGWDADADLIDLQPAGRQSPDQLAAGLNNPERLGYLVQDALLGDPALAPLLGPRPSGLRVMVLFEPGKGPQIYRAVWKIPRRRNIVDNFESGTLGNLLGAVDLDSGRVRRVVQGYGLAMREPSHHPDSGVPLSGIQLPHWSRVREITLAAAQLLPDLRFQHWDVALTDRGPILLEVNLFAAGGTELSQLVEGRGLLESRLLRACR